MPYTPLQDLREGYLSILISQMLTISHQITALHSSQQPPNTRCRFAHLACAAPHPPSWKPTCSVSLEKPCNPPKSLCCIHLHLYIKNTNPSLTRFRLRSLPQNRRLVLPPVFSITHLTCPSVITFITALSLTICVSCPLGVHSVFPSTHSQRPPQSLAQSWPSINICWINECAFCWIHNLSVLSFLL